MCVIVEGVLEPGRVTVTVESGGTVILLRWPGRPMVMPRALIEARGSVTYEDTVNRSLALVLD